MPAYSKSSLAKLATCDIRLQLICLEVIKHWDHTVVYGHRTKEEQDAAVAAGNSKTPWPNSLHNLTPSRAVDLAPWYATVPNGGIDWRTDKEMLVAVTKGDTKTALEILENIKRWMAFTGFVRGVAAAKGIQVRVGADWDGDQQFNDQTLIDLPHVELIV